MACTATICLNGKTGNWYAFDIDFERGRLQTLGHLIATAASPLYFWASAGSLQGVSYFFSGLGLTKGEKQAM